MNTLKTSFIKNAIITFLILISSVVFAQRNMIQFELEFSTIGIAATYEGFISDHMSLGAKLGLLTLGAEANYYLKPMDFDSWNSHIGVSYDLTMAWPATSFIHGPSLLIGIDHISGGGFFFGLEGGAMLANYTVDEPVDYRPKFYPMINLKLGKMLK
ncbi:MAG: hypothetical protein K9G76_03420 [Bacteroidales bacterium]|nr:hypothetical protein [Bacteroidales bacterium]MCF8402843.1 hypothetical protein [Bacteroidales bacterium]